MKKYVWSETRVEGGKPFTGTLAHPPSNTGAFPESARRRSRRHAGEAFNGPQFYADSVVIAYRSRDRLPPESRSRKSPTSSGTIDPALLSDGDLVDDRRSAHGQRNRRESVDPIRIPAAADHPRAHDRAPVKKSPLDDFLPPRRRERHELSKPATTVRTYHVVARYSQRRLRPNTPSPSLRSPRSTSASPSRPSPLPQSVRRHGHADPPPPTEHLIAELVLHPGARVNRFEEKAAFNPVPDLYGFATPDVAPQDAIRKSDVIDLTGKMHPDGTLDWTPPAGPLGRPAHRLFAARHHQPSRHQGSHRPRSRQAQRALREELHGWLSRQLQGDRRRGLDGQARHPLRRSTTVGRPARRTGPTT